MFKIVLLCALVGYAVALRPSNNKHAYSGQSSHAYSGQSSNNYNTKASSDDAHAEVRALHSNVNEQGFDYALETSNGIFAKSNGDAYGNVHGEYFYTSPEGVPVKVSYVADENGYQPSSDLLPTSPPIPEAILRSLEYIRTHPPKESHEQQFVHAPKGRAQQGFGHGRNY